MSELRLLPAACVVWAATLAGVRWGGWASIIAVVAVLVVALIVRDAGQAIIVFGLGVAASAVTALRMHTARAWQFGDTIIGRIAGQPVRIEGRGYLLRLHVPGHPGPVGAFVPETPAEAIAGATVQVTGTTGNPGRIGIAQVVYRGDVDVLSPPEGAAAWAHHVRHTFASAVADTVGESSRGLIPGMVLGDTSLQTQEEQQAYIATGLSHLSAVSGSNVAIVTAAAAVLASALGFGLRGRIIVAAAALTLFATLVGPEPSVLRASVMGLVGLAAVLSSSVAEPVHTLCLAVIGLILVDSTLALSFGFALSVAATAGIVALSPLLYRHLAVTRWPAIVLRALSVAIAADLVTMPLVALMAGEVSLVSVATNLLVAPVIAPVTILGLIAVVLSLLPGGLETYLLWVIHPLVWWIHHVAVTAAALPLSTVEAHPVQVAVCYGWVILGVLCDRVRLTLVLTVLVLVLGTPGTVGDHPWWTFPRPIDLSRVHVHVVTRESEIAPVPGGTQVVVVLEEGTAHERPVVTPGGLPVLYPHRDGEVWVYPDGTQRARNGTF